MAEPFGCVAVAETGLRLAIKLGKLIKDLRNAPDQLLALSNEVYNLKLVLDSVRQTLQNEKRLWPTMGVEPLLFQASIRFEEIDKIASRLGQLGPYSSQWNMRAWHRVVWYREKDRIAVLLGNLRELRSNISLALGAASSSTTAQVAIDVQGLLLHASRIDTENAHSLEKHRASLQELTRQVSPTMKDIRNTQEETNALLDALLQVVPQLSLQTPTPRTETHDSMESKRPIGNSNGSKGTRTSSQDSIPLNKASGPPIAIPVSPMDISRNACSKCPCACHRKQNLRTLAILTKVAGNLMLGYNGSIIFQQRCTVTACRKRSDKSSQVSYYFPSWFVQRAITLSMTSTAFGTPALNLKVRRVVSEMSELFRLSRFGDVQGVQTLFSAQEASPDDVNPIGGWTALHFAVDHGSVDFCRFLIQQGADPNWEDSTGMSPIEVARRNILQPRVCPQAAEIYGVLIPKADNLLERHFRHLHEIILGLTAGEIEDEIKSNPTSIETTDIYGWTPLHWAVRRNDAEAVKVLLRFGANPFTETGDDHASPLHLASRADSASCVRLLLQHRHRGKAVDMNGWDNRGRTPLRIAAGNNCVACTALLIEMGAEVDNLDRQNETALLSAVYESAHQTIPLLIKAGASTKAMTRSQNSILHFAANESDLRTLTLLTRARAHMRGIDVDAKNSDDFTARELAANRTGAAPGFVDAFDRLIASILDDGWTSPVYSASIVSDAESFKSFEEQIWYEVETLAEEDIHEAMRIVDEYRSESREGSPRASIFASHRACSMPVPSSNMDEELLEEHIAGGDALYSPVGQDVC